MQVFELFGSLFFGAVGKIEALPAQLPAGTRARGARDAPPDLDRHLGPRRAAATAPHAASAATSALVLANVNEQPLSLIHRSGFEAMLGADAIVPSVAEAAAFGPAPNEL